MYESIGRWMTAVAVTLVMSLVVIFLLGGILGRIHVGIRSPRTEGMIIGAFVTSLISVLIGPAAQAILKASGKKK